MARRFARISTLGQCAVILDGVASDPPRRARLVRQNATGRVYLIEIDDQRTHLTPVADFPTDALFDALAAFTWQAPFWLSDDDASESAPAN